jgi:hypothetical protein
MKEEKAHASAKSKELHPNAQCRPNAAHLLLPQPHSKKRKIYKMNIKYI